MNKLTLIIGLLLFGNIVHSQSLLKCDFETTTWDITPDWSPSTDNPLDGLKSLKSIGNFESGKVYEITSPTVLFQGDATINFHYQVYSNSRWYYQIQLINVDEGGFNYNGLPVINAPDAEGFFGLETHGASLSHYKLKVKFWSESSGGESTLRLDEISLHYTPVVSLPIKYKAKSFKFNKIIKVIQ